MTEGATAWGNVSCHTLPRAGSDFARRLLPGLDAGIGRVVEKSTTAPLITESLNRVPALHLLSNALANAPTQTLVLLAYTTLLFR